LIRPHGKSLLASLFVAAVLASPVTLALADVDPASDVLLQQNVFVPYQPQVCDQLKRQLTALTKKTRADGYPVKVAVIGKQYDLGGAPEFYGKPSAYAKFLGQELGVYGRDVGRNLARVPLLVVMPQGFGTFQVDPKGVRATMTVAVPSGADSNALARAAILAVPKVSTAAGHPVRAVKPATGCTKKSTSILLFAAPILAILVAGLGIHLARRLARRTAPA
jgi:hypothetical protein